MDIANLAKASIINVDFPSEGSVRCMFNPKEYSISKQNNWESKPTPGQNVPQLEFTSGGAATLQMQLLFDTYESGKDVRDVYTRNLWKMMMVDSRLRYPNSEKARPPKVRFVWGKSWSFDSVITSLKQQFTLFSPLGFPVRALVDVTFQQIADASLLVLQNPTSGGEGGERVWQVSDGDTLAWIAHKSYGDSTKWRLIADANRLTDLRRLPLGAVLVIPNE